MHIYLIFSSSETNLICKLSLNTYVCHLLENSHIFVFLPFRWVEMSTERSAQAKERDAVNRIRHYFVHVVNGVSENFLKNI